MSEKSKSSPQRLVKRGHQLLQLFLLSMSISNMPVLDVIAKMTQVRKQTAGKLALNGVRRRIQEVTDSV